MNGRTSLSIAIHVLMATIVQLSKDDSEDLITKMLTSAWYLVVMTLTGRNEMSIIASIDPLLAIFTSVATVIVWSIKGSGENSESIRIAKHASSVIPNIRSPEGSILTITEAARDLKRYLNSMSHAEFERCKMHEVEEDKRRPGDVSRGASRLRILLDKIKIPKHFGKVVKLGAGRGGWMQAMYEKCTWRTYNAYSRWRQPGQESLGIDPKKFNVTAISGEINHILPQQCDLLLSDAGENQPQFDDEITSTLTLLRSLTRFIALKPKYYIIRVPTIGSDDIVSIIKGWQSILCGGKLVRLATERNSVLTTYFISGDIEDPYNTAMSAIELCMNRVVQGKDQAPTIPRKVKNIGIKATWPEISRRLPVEPLQPLDISNEIKAVGYLNPPIGTTRFLKEIGWKPSNFSGSSGTHRNYYGWSIVKGITPLMTTFGLWRTTSTRAVDTYATVLKKVDHASLEDHDHYKRMRAVYSAKSGYIKDTSKGLRELQAWEIETTINKKGAMGW